MRVFFVIRVGNIRIWKTEKLKERKKLLLDLIYDKAYVPMKAKEIAHAFRCPQGPQRGELEEVLSVLTAEGKIGISKRGNTGRPETFSLTGIFSGNAGALAL